MENLQIKERGKVEFREWLKKVEARFDRPSGPIAITSSHIPASLDLTAAYGIRNILGWKNPITVIILDTVPPRVDYRAGFHGVHGYNPDGMVHLHPPMSFWNLNKPYHLIPPEKRRVDSSHIHEKMPYHEDIITLHEGLREEAYRKLGIGGVKFVRASEIVPRLYDNFLEKYGAETLRDIVNWLLKQMYVVGGSVVRGNVTRLVQGNSSAREKRGRRLLLGFVKTGDLRSLEQLSEMIRKGEVLPKGELFLALLLLNGYHHWGNNYLENPFAINEISHKYDGGRQLTERFEDAYSPIRLYLPGGEKTTALSSVVNVLHHLGAEPTKIIKGLLERSETLALVVPPRKV